MMVAKCCWRLATLRSVSWLPGMMRMGFFAVLRSFAAAVSPCSKRERSPAQMRMSACFAFLTRFLRYRLLAWTSEKARIFIVDRDMHKFLYFPFLAFQGWMV